MTAIAAAPGTTPTLCAPDPAAGHRGALTWRFDEPVVAVSSASVGGGLLAPAWVVNLQVPLDYARTDLDAHVAEVGAACGLDGPGIGLLTAADVDRWSSATDGGVVCDATVGITKPTWASGPDGSYTDWRPGTINLVVRVPVPMTPGALVGAVVTATEAKTQALMAAGVPGTGTASDAVVVVCPDPAAPGAPPAEAFAGPRSTWGARIARAVYAAVRARSGGSVVLVLGGTRSGKSAYAEGLLAHLPAVTYLATATVDPGDADHVERIRRHRDRRPATWTTREVGADLPAALADVDGPVLVDSLGTWVASHADLDPDVDALVTALAQRRWPTVVVAEEVGLSLHAPTPVGRRFVDALGRVNAAVGEVVDRAVLVVAGRPVALPRRVGAAWDGP
jgi:adenosylcobinamide hydrolase